MTEISDIQLTVRNTNKRKNLTQDIPLKQEQSITRKLITTENWTTVFVTKRARGEGSAGYKAKGYGEKSARSRSKVHRAIKPSNHQAAKELSSE